MDYLRELYLGKVFPADSHTNEDPAYQETADLYTAQYDTLFQRLHVEEQAELRRLNDLHDLLLTMQDEAAFKLGFRLGVQMMCACFCTKPPSDKP